MNPKAILTRKPGRRSGLQFMPLLLAACSGGGSNDAAIDGQDSSSMDGSVDSGISTGTGTDTSGGTDAGTYTSADVGTENGTDAGTGAETGDGTDTGTRPSCAGLSATCGPSGNESCCASLLVPGGTFNRTNSGNDHPATVSDYYLDKYEITVGRFRVFVNAGMGTQSNPPAAGAGAHPLITGSGWNPAWNANLPADPAALNAARTRSLPLSTWTATPGDNENRPQNYLDWYTAFAFCAWDGGRMPTDAEWNYATAGGSEQRKHPWGAADADYTMASYDCMGDGVSGCSLTDFILVGTKPAGNGRWGHADLAGNVWEWTLDCFGEDQMPCNDCANLLDPTFRIMEGGSAGNPDTYLGPGDYARLTPGQTNAEIGARCARSTP